MAGDFPAGIFSDRGFPHWVLFLPRWKPVGMLHLLTFCFLIIIVLSMSIVAVGGDIFVCAFEEGRLDIWQDTGLITLNMYMYIHTDMDP